LAEKVFFFSEEEELSDALLVSSPTLPNDISVNQEVNGRSNVIEELLT